MGVGPCVCVHVSRLTYSSSLPANVYFCAWGTIVPRPHVCSHICSSFMSFFLYTLVLRNINCTKMFIFLYSRVHIQVFLYVHVTLFSMLFYLIHFQLSIAFEFILSKCKELVVGASLWKHHACVCMCMWYIIVIRSCCPICIRWYVGWFTKYAKLLKLRTHSSQLSKVSAHLHARMGWNVAELASRELINMFIVYISWSVHYIWEST